MTTRSQRYQDKLKEISNGDDKYVSNKSLREALGWDETKYKLVRAQLVTEGLIVPGRGQGGSVKLAMPVGKTALQVFISYSHEDESLRNQLVKHLEPLRRMGLIDTWHDRKLKPGDDWENVISENLTKSDIILLLVSIDFINSKYCYDIELEQALERHDKEEATVIPIILRNCLWSHTPFAKLQALPKDAKAVKAWPDMDEAFKDIAAGVQIAAENILATR